MNELLFMHVRVIVSMLFIKLLENGKGVYYPITKTKKNIMKEPVYRHLKLIIYKFDSLEFYHLMITYNVVHLLHSSMVYIHITYFTTFYIICKICTNNIKHVK